MIFYFNANMAGGGAPFGIIAMNFGGGGEGGAPETPSAPARTLRVRKGSLKWAFLLMAGTALTNV